MPEPTTTPEAATQASEWNWYWGCGSDPEVYHPAGSREEAIELATEVATANGQEEMTVCEGKPWPLYDDIFDADNVLEIFHDKNDDRCDEDGGLQMEPTHQQKIELETALNAAFKTWRTKHGLGRAWAMDTRNDEVVTLEPAAIERARADG